MKRLVLVLALAIVVALTGVAFAQGQGQGQGPPGLASGESYSLFGVATAATAGGTQAAIIGCASTWSGAASQVAVAPGAAIVVVEGISQSVALGLASAGSNYTAFGLGTFTVNSGN